MKFTEQKRLEMIGRLKATFSVEGRDGLAKMSPLEVHILYTELMVDRRQAQEKLKQRPNDLNRALFEKAERDASVVAGYLRGIEKDRGNDKEMER